MHDRAHLKQAPGAYFDAVDAKDMDGALSFFAPDATFTIQSAHITFEGRLREATALKWSFWQLLER
jgi:ketosteroid isomerase-like protein